MWSINQSHLYLTAINLGVVSILQIIFLVRYILVSNRDLARFFEAFQFQDATLSFEHKKGDNTFLPLYREFDRILDEYRKIRKEQEKDRLFFMNILNHVHTGVLVTDLKGNVLYSNNAVRKFTGGREIKQLNLLDRLRSGLSGVLLKMKPDKREIVRVVYSNEVVMLSIRCSEYKLEGETIRIISFQDINYEIEQREIEAWQKLISILTHEITNSVSPITLTSAGLINLLEKGGQPREPEEIDEPIVDNVLLGLHAIRKRSKGLANFVENYRSMTQIPQPNFIRLKVNELFQSIESLMQDDLRNQQITLYIPISKQNLQLEADEKLIEQVLINLINNAAYALKGIENAIIKLDAWQNNQSVYFSVTDNGKGISPENLENIFVPFFTTKTDGSGIGLSLSRQIMRLHSGNITVNSLPGVETVFTLRF